MINNSLKNLISSFLSKYNFFEKPPISNYLALDFCWEAAKDPFLGRFKLPLKSNFELFLKVPIHGLTSNCDKILIEKMKIRKFEDFINEISHLIVKSIEEDKVIYSIAEHRVHNTVDYKTTDLLFKLNDRSIVKTECKTVNLLSRFLANRIVKQFSLTKNINEINFSILYRESKVSETEFSNILYKDLGVVPSCIKFINLEKLKDIFTEENLIKFSKLYENKPHVEYISELEEIIFIALQDVKNNTNDGGIKKAIEKILEKRNNIDFINKIKTKNFYNTIKKPSDIHEDLNDNPIADSVVENFD